MQHDVLVIDDETELAEACADYLRAYGLVADTRGDAESALEWLRRHDTRLVLLDVNLPGASGFDLCRRLRVTTEVPILFISARGGEDDEILALSIGGDDYLTKPFSLALLLAKVQRMLARTRPSAGEEDFNDGWLRVDAQAGRTYVDGAEVHLKAMEDKLLRYLVARQGEVVTKAELFDHVWGEPLTSDGTLAVHVRRVRARIEPDPDQPVYIRTVWGRGYLFEPPPTPAPSIPTPLPAGPTAGPPAAAPASPPTSSSPASAPGPSGPSRPTAGPRR